jgi:hypothetical protein
MVVMLRLTALAVVLGSGAVAVASPDPTPTPTPRLTSFELGGSFGVALPSRGKASLFGFAPPTPAGGAYASVNYLADRGGWAFGLFARASAIGFSDDGAAGFGSLSAGFQLWGQHWGYCNGVGYGATLFRDYDGPRDQGRAVWSGGVALEGRVAYAISGHQRSGLVLSIGGSMFIFGTRFDLFAASTMLSVGYQVF